MKRLIFKNIISWFSAFVVAFIAINVICFGYNRDTAGVSRTGGALSFAYQPGTLIIDNSEGNGWSRVDENGYLNASADLSEDGYVLVLGNSMTNAVQVDPTEKYVSVLNEFLQNDYSDTKTHAYLMARGGASFTELAQGYSAAVAEFPAAKVVVIQIIGGSVSFSSLDEIKNQRVYDETQNVQYILEHEGFIKKFKHLVKNYVPIASFLAHERLYNFQNPFKGAFIYKTSSPGDTNYWDERDIQAETDELTETLEYLNALDDRQLIILNLPSEYIGSDGKLGIANSNIEAWKQACDTSGVTFVDMTEEWQDLYNAQNKLAYGFSNTSPAYGHMNKYGHEAVGKKLYNVISQKGIF